MPKYEQHRAGDGGGEWSKWVSPRRSGYRLMCCDCGLVHLFQFALIPWGRGKKIIFRCRRHKRATSAARRAKQKFVKSK